MRTPLVYLTAVTCVLTGFTATSDIYVANTLASHRRDNNIMACLIERDSVSKPLPTRQFDICYAGELLPGFLVDRTYDILQANSTGSVVELAEMQVMSQGSGIIHLLRHFQSYLSACQKPSLSGIVLIFKYQGQICKHRRYRG